MIYIYLSLEVLTPVPRSAKPQLFSSVTSWITVGSRFLEPFSLVCFILSLLSKVWDNLEGSISNKDLGSMTQLWCKNAPTKVNRRLSLYHLLDKFSATIHRRQTRHRGILNIVLIMKQQHQVFCCSLFICEVSKWSSVLLGPCFQVYNLFFFFFLHA